MSRRSEGAQQPQPQALMVMLQAYAGEWHALAATVVYDLEMMTRRGNVPPSTFPPSPPSPPQAPARPPWPRRCSPT